MCNDISLGSLKWGVSPFFWGFSKVCDAGQNHFLLRIFVIGRTVPLDIFLSFIRSPQASWLFIKMVVKTNLNLLSRVRGCLRLWPEPIRICHWPQPYAFITHAYFSAATKHEIWPLVTHALAANLSPQSAVTVDTNKLIYKLWCMHVIMFWNNRPKKYRRKIYLWIKKRVFKSPVVLVLLFLDGALDFL